MAFITTPDKLTNVPLPLVPGNRKFIAGDYNELKAGHNNQESRIIDLEARPIGTSDIADSTAVTIGALETTYIWDTNSKKRVSLLLEVSNVATLQLTLSNIVNAQKGAMYAFNNSVGACVLSLPVFDITTGELAFSDITIPENSIYVFEFSSILGDINDIHWWLLSRGGIGNQDEGGGSTAPVLATIASAASITVPLSTADIFTVNLETNITTFAITGGVTGKYYTLRIIQDVTGNRLFSATIPAGTTLRTLSPIVLSETPNSIDVFQIYVSAVDTYEIRLVDYAE